jgi:hypothetical protein
MALEKAMVTGTRGILEWFDRNATTPYYSVWVNRKQLLFSWNDDDLDAGRTKLEDDLNAIEQNGVSDLLIIKLHPKKEKGGFITDKSPIYASLNFRPAELERPNYGMQQMGGMGYSNKMENVLERVLETQNAILTKLNAEDLEDEDEPQQNTLGSLLNNPQVLSLLMAGVSKFLGVGNVDAQGASIAGIDDVNENEAILILNSLMSKGVSVEHLRKLNAMSSAKLSSLLIML